MSIAGIAGSSFFSGAIAQSSHTKVKQAQQDFQRLGQDLQAGNLAQAQTDLTTLQKDFPEASSAIEGLAQQGLAQQGMAQQGVAQQGVAQNDSGTVQPRFQQLSQDLKAGNLAAAQADFATLRQDLQPGNGPAIHPHTHPRYAEGSAANTNGIAPVLSQLGQALQSSNISAAQQSYATLLQEFQQAGAGTGLVGPVAGSSGAVSLSA